MTDYDKMNAELDAKIDATVASVSDGIEQLKAENAALKRDLAMRPSSLTELYKIREALGFNKYFPLSHLESKARRLRQLYLEKGGDDNF